ncbi:type II secretion system F domain protein [Rhodopirellula maiorica SM1]|uniref:Type II secretion system F domain protein n=1 Tax=Rhodopirellula maiorica SM1 TaxID=1265738 RepID=M5RRD7_9BACT|nr:type II secretion system F family protein [Rhodopirellula maiorica]EMI21898.1 type II secretion system F domain protein [Rhodopirellula maiorica SM1]
MNEFDQIVDFNEQLVVIASTGMPIAIARSGSRQSVKETTSQLHARIGVRVARGDSIRAAIEDDSEISPQYRQSLLLLLRTGDTAAALDAATAMARSQRMLKRNISQWLFQTTIVVFLALMAFVFTLSFTTPQLESFYQDMGIQEGSVLSLLEALRESMGVWLAGLLILGIIGWWFWRRYRDHVDWSAIPGGKGYRRAVTNSELAEQMATLYDQGVSMPDSLVICGIRTGAEPTNKTKPGTGVVPAPLLQWAIGGGVDEQSRSEVLRFIAAMYRQKAERLATVWRFLVPSIATAVVGGIIVLLYALSLFLPWIHFLKVLTLA